MTSQKRPLVCEIARAFWPHRDLEGHWLLREPILTFEIHLLLQILDYAEGFFKLALKLFVLLENCLLPLCELFSKLLQFFGVQLFDILPLQPFGFQLLGEQALF